MTDKRKELIVRAVERVIDSVASGHSSIGAGGLFELAYPFAAADVPDVTAEEIMAAFAAAWGVDAEDRALYQRVLAVCDRHDPLEDESIKDILHRASCAGDLEAAYLLSLTGRSS